MHVSEPDFSLDLSVYIVAPRASVTSHHGSCAIKVHISLFAPSQRKQHVRFCIVCIFVVASAYRTRTLPAMDSYGGRAKILRARKLLCVYLKVRAHSSHMTGGMKRPEYYRFLRWCGFQVLEQFQCMEMINKMRIDLNFLSINSARKSDMRIWYPPCL